MVRPFYVLETIRPALKADLWSGAALQCTILMARYLQMVHPFYVLERIRLASAADLWSGAALHCTILLARALPWQFETCMWMFTSARLYEVSTPASASNCRHNKAVPHADFICADAHNRSRVPASQLSYSLGAYES